MLNQVVEALGSGSGEGDEVYNYDYTMEETVGKLCSDIIKSKNMGI